MAPTYRQQFLSLMVQNERAMTDLYADLHTRIMLLVSRAATGDNQTIPPQNSQRIRDQISREVLSTFVDMSPNGGMQAFKVVAGRVMPQSPYMLRLWPLMEQAVKVAVAEHAAIIRRKLRRAPAVLRALEMARKNPLYAARQVREQTIPRRPFLQYDPLHLFVDPRGYRLSDRIWDTATTTRRKIDQLLAEMIAEGRSSLDISRELEQFLQPGRGIRRTNKPYGTTASFDGMRLSRTEITAGAGRAGKMAASMNPFVIGANWVRSTSHRVCSTGICDELQAGSPYPLDRLPDLPGDSHPFCLCHYEWITVDDTAPIIDDLTNELPGGPAAPPSDWSWLWFVGPILVDKFARMLLDEPDEQGEFIW